MNELKMNDNFSWKKSINDKELLTVTRGTCTSEGERITKVWNQVVTGGVKDAEIPTLIKKIKDCKWNYGGVFYSVYFRVDTPILLRELGFFGPFAEQKASYFVHVEIFKPKSAAEAMPSAWDSPRIAKRKLNVVAKKDELFYVDLGDGVPIEPGIWHLIQFNLDGPNTLRSESCKKIVTVESEEGPITFEFNIGSFQLPCMKFQVLSGSQTVSNLRFYTTKEC